MHNYVYGNIHIRTYMVTVHMWNFFLTFIVFHIYVHTLIAHFVLDLLCNNVVPSPMGSHDFPSCSTSMRLG